MGVGSGGISLGIGYANGKAERLGNTTLPKPVFDESEWATAGGSVMYNVSMYNPGVWAGLESLEACPPVMRLRHGNQILWEMDG